MARTSVWDVTRVERCGTSVWDVTRVERCGATVGVEHGTAAVEQHRDRSRLQAVELSPRPGVEALSLCRLAPVKLGAYSLADRPFVCVRQGSAKALQGQAVAEDHWSDRDQPRPFDLAGVDANESASSSMELEHRW